MSDTPRWEVPNFCARHLNKQPCEECESSWRREKRIINRSMLFFLLSCLAFILWIKFR